MFSVHVLTTFLVKVTIYMQLLCPKEVAPPNSRAVFLLSGFMVKPLIGGGLFPVTIGDSHSPNS